ncbi:methyl-accepting chemotaxis protein [Hwanghaeella grinnelliae]|uniref:Methyl-accepting chemotaxis protein n=1 Tax=Hwanghaeella grinnelliae TaxID=2500179 RepID=A0A437QYB9_9PROT|nr:CHASE3 domain-containing protein [Hwanghaeella grinnelliae]RVU39479.1 methyl-accepting chemotaxis protein [Hwanghaeella grinnelliae]
MTGSTNAKRFRFANLKTRTKVLVGTGIPIALAALVSGIGLYDINSITQTNKWVDHTRVVLSESSAVVSSAVNMETGMRGYLLAGQDNFLDPYNQGEGAVYDQIKHLQETVSDNPPQVARLEEAATVLREWQTKVAEEQIQLRRDIGTAETMTDLIGIVREARGKQYFDKFREQVATFSDREKELLGKRLADFKTALRSGSVGADGGESLKWVEHTYAVIGKADSMLAAAIDMETGMRGFLLAGQEEFLEPYNSGNETFHEIVAELQDTVSDNPAQVALLQEIDTTISDWATQVVEPMIDLRRKIGNAKNMDDMADLVGEARGKQYFDKFRQIMADFQAEEAGLMISRKAQNEETVSTAFVLLIAFTIIAVVVGIGAALIIGGSISRPIGGMTLVMRKLADGDTSVDVIGADRRDEVGEMASATQVFKEKLIEADQMRAEATARDARDAAQRKQQMLDLANQFESEVGGIITTVSSAATELQQTSRSMSGTADEAAAQTTAVASASEQTTTNVQTVASAAEELTSSINEISRQIGEANKVAAKAVEEAELSNTSVRELADSAAEIGSVISLIQDIAEQTNLLALNATIEAARAGEAGKGFSVVANEVKSLASQTSKATDAISGRIASMQSATEMTVESIERVVAIIKQISENTSAVAAAVEEQDSSTQEIARNVQQAASGTREVSSNIGKVQEAATETGLASREVLEASQELAKQSETLRHQVNEFVAGLRTA